MNPHAIHHDILFKFKSKIEANIHWHMTNRNAQQSTVKYHTSYEYYLDVIILFLNNLSVYVVDTLCHIVILS